MKIVRSSLYEKLLIGEPVTVTELKDILNKKVINFEFVKLDGDVRPAKGTTMMKYIPKEDHPTGDHPSSNKVAAFFDLSKNAWRSVSNRSKEIVLDKDEETGKPKIVISDKEPKTKTPAKKIMPSEKDVEKRPLVPKAEPIIRPTVKPEEPTIPSPEEIERREEIEEVPLDIDNTNVSAEDVRDEDIIVTTGEPEEEEVEAVAPEVPEEPAPAPIVRPSITNKVGPQPEIIRPEEEKLPPRKQITFPDEEEEEKEEEEKENIQ